MYIMSKMWIWYVYLCTTLYSGNLDSSSFPEMYAHSLRMQPQDAIYISGKLQVLMLQLLCKTSKANNLDVNMAMTIESFIMHVWMIWLWL